MKKYHVYGLGNALLDREAKVNEAFLKSMCIEKGVMTLLDEKTFQELADKIKPALRHKGCGGSAANTMIALSQFGGKGFYSCKVANDEIGQLFLQELAALGLDCNLNAHNLSTGITGQCLVLVTEDAQRTMNTHLGISETLCSKALNLEAIAAADYLYLEGYLVTSASARQALFAAYRHARLSATKIALTLSDPNIVLYFKEELLSVIGEGVDLLFCNEEEALLFTEANELNAAVALLQPLAKHLVITCGSRGALLAIDGEVLEIPTTPIKAIDTVGAGDMFAGAYLYGITHGFAPVLAIELAHKAAAKVVSQYGARLNNSEINTIKSQFIAKNYSLLEDKQTLSVTADPCFCE